MDPEASRLRNRVVLLKSDNTTVHVKEREITLDLNNFADKQVYVTGGFDSCTQTVSITNPEGVEVL